MCNIQQNPVGGLGLLVADAYMNALALDTEDSADLDYASSLAGLEHAQAAARESAGTSMADSAAGRESALRKAAQELGQKRAARGASGFGLDSGSLLALSGDEAAQAQREAADYTRQMQGEAAAQRLNEEYYGQKKNLLHEKYRRAEKNSRASSLLGGYNQWRGNLLGLDSLVGKLVG